MLQPLAEFPRTASCLGIDGTAYPRVGLLFAAVVVVMLFSLGGVFMFIFQGLGARSSVNTDVFWRLGGTSTVFTLCLWEPVFTGVLDDT